MELTNPTMDDVRARLDAHHARTFGQAGDRDTRAGALLGILWYVLQNNPQAIRAFEVATSALEVAA